MKRVLKLLRLALGTALFALASAPVAAAPLDNAGCLQCHDTKAAKVEVSTGGKKHALKAVPPEGFGQGVHGKLACTACHTGATDSPKAGEGHKLDAGRTLASASCNDCHNDLWAKAQADGSAAQKPRLGVVVQNAQAYAKSFHALPAKADKSRPNAVCDDCHDTHTFAIPPKDSPEHAKWKLTSAAGCAEKCHSDELEEFSNSVHGKETLELKNTKSAVCADCHSAHAIGNTSASPVKLAITASCGSCHQANYESYKATYHGQISTLGYAHTAKCFDCHGSHGILRVADKESKVHPDNRLETCRSCHGKKGVGPAPDGFASFQPHGRTDDFKRYPQMWLGYRMMVGLLVGTFAFFWLHTALWFFREWQERKQQRTISVVSLDKLGLKPEQHVQRFSALWRLGHLLFAVSLMVLTLTGGPLFYPEAAWAPKLMQLLGGPKVAGMIHRVSAVIFAAVFFWHLGYMALNLWRKRKTFRWFGPDSMIPNLQDGWDMLAMFKWFFGMGPRPVFDRWTYWEKFDYWAPFWGVTIIGVSGLMMWLPNLTGSFLPGWVFNVAAIFHGEEAFLAVVFLFTVHFFNNHFRPDKFPLEVVMFTGSMTLDHFRREHPLHFQRLVDSGELKDHLVDAPSPPMAFGAKVLGFALIAAGLTLLAGVAIGFFTAG